MKELIVIVGMLILGTIIFNMIAGDENSLRAAAVLKLTEIRNTYEVIR